MESADVFGEPADKRKESEISQRSPLADIISLETVINVLLKRGLCTPEELFEEERKLREYNSQVKDISFVHTNRLSHSQKEEKSRRNKHSWMKRKMSKRRWTRRLGALIFGWQWKKVKTNKHTVQINNSEGNSTSKQS